MKSKEHDRNSPNQPNRRSGDGDLKNQKRKIRVCKIFENVWEKRINRERIINSIKNEYEFKKNKRNRNEFEN